MRPVILSGGGVASKRPVRVTAPGLRPWAVGLFTVLASCVASAVGAAVFPQPRIYVEAYDESGAPVVAQIYRRTTGMRANAVQNGPIYTITYGTGGMNDYTLFGDSMPFSEPLPGRGCSHQALPTDRGPGDFDAMYQHSRNSAGLPGGGIGACYDTWYGGYQLAGGTSGRVEHARIFSGSATDADGNRLVFDRIETPDLPACAQWEIRERQFVFVWKGSLPAYDYYSPEPCEYDVLLKGVYRTVEDGEDSDGDGLPDHSDNCPAAANEWQRDADLDGLGDACDDAYVFDSDHDGIMDADDNCRYRFNPGQDDLDGDGRGDRCDADIDGDGRVGPLVVNFNNGASSLVTARQQIYLDDADLSATDNCPRTYNPDQIDSDGDYFGDACQLDHDGDGVENAFDNCPSHYNPGQQDTDGNGTGDVCEYDVDGDHVYTTPGTRFMDNCPGTYNMVHTDSDLDGVGDVCDPDYDSDGDGIPNVQDNCPSVGNPQQQDMDGDGIGDLCDADNDNDAIPDVDDNCPLTPNVGQDDTDGDGDGDACDADVDNDGIANADDNCPATYNPDQRDSNGNGQGDACFDDEDNDGIEDHVDNCPAVFNSAQSDFDGDGIGDACDEDLDGDGVLGQSDQCEFTGPGEFVDPQNGCSLEQSCPCDSPRGESVPWRNKGKFVSCSAGALDSLLDQRLISREEKDALQSAAAQGSCGMKK